MTTTVAYYREDCSNESPAARTGPECDSANSSNSMASCSSRSSQSNPEDPHHQTDEQAGKRPMFQLSSQTSTEEEDDIQNAQRRESTKEYPVSPENPMGGARSRSDSWNLRQANSASAARVVSKMANFRKSATQTNLFGGTSSFDEFAQQHLVAQAGRRWSCWPALSSGSSLNSSLELLEQHPTPPDVTSLAESVPVVSVAKHVHTEQILAKHSLKTHLTNCQRLLDAYFGVLAAQAGAACVGEQVILDGLSSVCTLMCNAWQTPQIGVDLAYGLCDYIRENGYLRVLVEDYFLSLDRSLPIVTAAARALVPVLNSTNRMSVTLCLEPIVQVVKQRLIDDGAKSNDSTSESLITGISLLEQLFKCYQSTALRLLDLSALDYCLNACKTSRDVAVHRHAAVALANLCINSDDKECQQRIMAKNVPDWLYFLASSRDDNTRYYACLAVCLLVHNKECEASVCKSGALSLVEPFLRGRNPIEFAFAADYRHQGRTKVWLTRLVSLLYSKRREPRVMAAFHLALDASIKKDQDRLDELRDVGAVEALRQAAGMPEELASDFARRALEVIGETAPYKLKPQVPLWTVDDVQYWVVQIGFENYSNAFRENQVDGDLLLLLSDEDLENDIGMKSGLFRKRFMRELDSLKMAADYSCVDGTKLDRFLTSVSARFSIYTYPLLELGVTDCREIPSLSDDVLKHECRIINPVHRMKLLKAIEDCPQIGDMEVAVLKKHIDIFISYRRSTGSQLASLLKVLLQLRGYKVFIDVDRLYAGQFDYSLFKNIQAADHFLLVLSPQSMERCVDDEDCNDWVHKEIACAMRFSKNIIPILDPQFEWPDEFRLPGDIRLVKQFNQVNWIHEYQDACVSKIEKFVKDYSNINRKRCSLVPCDSDTMFEHVLNSDCH